jgi:uncharacterized membrane protein YqaE (UPF0057 family)
MRKKLLVFSFPLFMSVLSFTSYAAIDSKDQKEAATAVTPEPVVGSVQEAMKEFRELSHREKRSRFKEMKKALKEFEAQKKQGADVSTNTLLLILIAIFIPPLAVYLHEGEINNTFWISVLLTVLGYILFGWAGVLFLGSIPGIIHALIVILQG